MLETASRKTDYIPTIIPIIHYFQLIYHTISNPSHFVSGSIRSRAETIYFVRHRHTLTTESVSARTDNSEIGTDGNEDKQGDGIRRRRGT